MIDLIQMIVTRRMRLLLPSEAAAAAKADMMCHTSTCGRQLLYFLISYYFLQSSPRVVDSLQSNYR